jgi:hypothetical protein
MYVRFEAVRANVKALVLRADVKHSHTCYTTLRHIHESVTLILIPTVFLNGY